jgi:hypothetical protein
METSKCPSTDEWIKKKRLKFCPLHFKQVELENIILSEVSQFQKTKGCMFFLLCGIQIQYKYNQYYERQVTLRRGH